MSSEAKKRAAGVVSKAKTYNIIKEIPDTWNEPPKGKHVCTCKTCGKEFEQDYNKEKNCYTSYKNCPECRRKKSYKKEKQMAKEQEGKQEVALDYIPYPWQEKAHNDFQDHRFQVLACGNRSGKDRYTNMEGIIYFVECLNENRHIYRTDLEPSVYWWIIAPTDKMAKQNWRELKKYFPKQWVVDVSESTETMYTVGGGTIEVRSAYDPESLVGVGLDLVTITEAARIRDMRTVWGNLEARLSSPGRGRNVDRKGKSYGVGKAIINSSPIGKNYFYQMWTWGQKNHENYDNNWISYQLPWTCNPANEELAKSIVKTKYGSITYEESLRRRIGDNLYRQNYLADFLAGDGTVFKNFEENCIVNIYSGEFNFNAEQRRQYIEEWKRVRPYRKYRASWDVATGSSQDSPTLIIRDMETNHIVRVIDLYGKKYEQQYDTIAMWCKYYNNAECVYSLTGHTAVAGQLSQRGVYEITTDEQGGRKAEFVQRLDLAVECKALKVLYDGSSEVDTLVRQMQDYTEENGKYSNKQQPHDDFVSALYLNYYDFDAQVEKLPFLGLMGCIG